MALGSLNHLNHNSQTNDLGGHSSEDESNPMGALPQLQSGFVLDSQIFQKQLWSISNTLDKDPEPFKPVSKDHTRVNRVGVNLEHLEAKNHRLKNERRSLDMSTVKKKKFNNIS